MMPHYESDGAIWEEGEIPKCSFCGTGADETTLFDTSVHDTYCCEEEDCRAQLGYMVFRGEIELKED